MRCESGYSDKRHPEKISFTNDIIKDLQRRDFTINAMAKRNGEILDLFDGKKDLENKIIRAVGNPDNRIKEDVLRSLRAVRFATSLDFNIEENLKSAIRKHAASIDAISKDEFKLK